MQAMNTPRRTAATQIARKMDPEAMRSHASDAAQLMRALANDKRLMLLCLLVEGEHSVSALNAKVELSQSALSQHLAVLREDGLVTTRREAQTIYYALAPGPAEAVMRTLHGIYCAPARGGKTRGK